MVQRREKVEGRPVDRRDPKARAEYCSMKGKWDTTSGEGRGAILVSPGGGGPPAALVVPIGPLHSFVPHPGRQRESEKHTRYMRGFCLGGRIPSWCTADHGVPPWLPEGSPQSRLWCTTDPGVPPTLGLGGELSAPPTLVYCWSWCTTLAPSSDKRESEKHTRYMRGALRPYPILGYC